jgi:hypothetical protein
MPHRDLHRRLLSVVDRALAVEAYERNDMIDPRGAYEACHLVRKLIQTYEHSHHEASHKKPKPRDLADTTE